MTFCIEDNYDTIQKKEEYIDLNFLSEHEPFIPFIPFNNTSPSSETIDIAMNSVFPPFRNTIELDEIKENDAYFIERDNCKSINNKTIKLQEKSLNNCFDKNKGTDISSQKKLSDNSSNFKQANPLLGRKRKFCEKEGFHTKDSYDNKIRKIKGVVLQEVRIFINKIIKEISQTTKKFEGRELIKINPKQFIYANIMFNREFIHKSLKEIFSGETTIKNHCSSDHKNLINELLEDKKVIFEDIFKLEFLEVLDYLVGKRPELIQLKGLIFPEKFEQKEEKDEYKTSIRYIIENFEAILYEKQPRNKKNKKKKI